MHTVVVSIEFIFQLVQNRTNKKRTINTLRNIGVWIANAETFIFLLTVAFLVFFLSHSIKVTEKKRNKE